MNKLPNKCATRNMDGEAIVIENGTEGYYMLDEMVATIDEINAANGADEKAIEVMTCASMFGWEIPAVLNYEPKEA